MRERQAYPIARDLANFVRKKSYEDIRLRLYTSAAAGIDILILGRGKSIWAALSMAPSPAILMGLFLRFPPPVRFSWPGKVGKV
jgi:hypothetical protein